MKLSHWEQLSPTHKHLIVLVFYTVFFLALFLQFPLKGALPGNCDALFPMIVPKIYLHELLNFIFRKEYGSIMYPAVNNFQAYGEPFYGVGLIFSFFRGFGLNDIWSYYFFLTAIFALTGFGVYLLATLFVRPLFASFAGFAFSCSNHAFATMDDSYCLFYFLPAMCLYFLFKFFREKRAYLCYLSAVTGGLQIFFSTYVFIYQSVVLLVILILWIFILRRKLSQRDKRILGLSTLIYIFIVSPFFIYYFWVQYHLSIVSFSDFNMIKLTGLLVNSPTYVLSNNLLYPNLSKTLNTCFWVDTRWRTFSGFSLMFLAATALYKCQWKQFQFVIMAMIGLFFAYGVAIAQGDRIFIGPLGHLYLFFPFLQHLRVTSRAYFLVTFALSVLAGLGLEKVVNFLRKRVGAVAVVIVPLFFIIHFFENTPFPFKAFVLKDVLEIPKDCKLFLKDLKKEVVLDLPSNLNREYLNWDENIFGNPYNFVKREDKYPELMLRNYAPFDSTDHVLFKYNRELIYMHWQSEHEQSIIGGTNGYLPTSRMIFQHYINDIPDDKVFSWLKKQGVTLIAFHKNMVLAGEEHLLQDIESSPLLVKEFEGETTVFFRFKPDG